MNLIDHYVIKVCKVHYANNKWWVEVLAESHGRKGMTFIMFDSEEEAKKVSKGYKFLA